MAALVDLPGLAARISADLTREDLVILKLLWRRAKDVADLHALIAATADLDADFVRETLADILPPEDPRLTEFEELFTRFGTA